MSSRILRKRRNRDCAWALLAVLLPATRCLADDSLPGPVQAPVVQAATPAEVGSVASSPSRPTIPPPRHYTTDEIKALMQRRPPVPQSKPLPAIPSRSRESQPPDIAPAPVSAPAPAMKQASGSEPAPTSTGEPEGLGQALNTVSAVPTSVVAQAPNTDQAAGTARTPKFEQAPLSQTPTTDQAPLSQTPTTDQAPLSQTPTTDQAPLSQTPTTDQAPSLKHQPQTRRPSLKHQPQTRRPLSNTNHRPGAPLSNTNHRPGAPLSNTNHRPGAPLSNTNRHQQTRRP